MNAATPVTSAITPTGTELPISLIQPDADQHRKFFDEQALQELASSIANLGMLEPIVVVPDNSHYRIVAGERRWRAACLAGLQRVPVSIRELTPLEIATVQATENIARRDVRPCEEGRAYERIWNEYMAQRGPDDTPRSCAAWIAAHTGSSWNRVDSKIRLLQLPPEVQQLVDSGALKEGIGYSLTKLTFETEDYSLAENRAHCIRLARQAVAHGLSYQEVHAKIAAYLGEVAQTRMFEHETRDNEEHRQARKAMDAVLAHLERVADLTFSENDQKLKLPALGDNELATAEQKLRGAMKHMGQLLLDIEEARAEAVSQEMPGDDGEEGPRVFTWGYRGHSHADLRALLDKWGIRRLVDVRRSVEGRNVPWRASTLRTVFSEYEHQQALGNSWEAKDGEWVPLDEERADHAVGVLAGVYAAGEGPIVLMCAETSPNDCHRRHVAEAVAAAATVGVKHLF